MMIKKKTHNEANKFNKFKTNSSSMEFIVKHRILENRYKSLSEENTYFIKSYLSYAKENEKELYGSFKQLGSEYCSPGINRNLPNLFNPQISSSAKKFNRYYLMALERNADPISLFNNRLKVNSTQEK